MDDDRLRETVIEFLGRVILYAGQDAIETYRADPRHETQIEHVFERFRPHLPSS